MSRAHSNSFRANFDLHAQFIAKMPRSQRVPYVKATCHYEASGAGIVELFAMWRIIGNSNPILARFIRTQAGTYNASRNELPCF